MSLLRLGAWLLLYLGAGSSLWVEAGALGAPRPPDLARLPARVGALALGIELEFDAALLGSQPPEVFAYRRVTDDEGHAGELFIAYYRRAQRWSGRPHDLETCFAAQGWEERESHRLEEAHRPWSRRFERTSAEGARESIRVVHWLERPGPDDDRVSLAELGARLASARGFRPDVASVYFQFPAEAAPSEGSLTRSVAALSAALEDVWGELARQE